jgi:hypothetical protein
MQREWITPITVGAFLLTAVTGVLLFFHVGMGMNKLAHQWVSLILTAVVVVHMAINLNVLKKYLSQRKGQVLVGVFVLLLGLSFLPLGQRQEPSFAPSVRALAQVPLNTLAQVAGTTSEQIIERLQQAGLAVQSDQQSLRELVGNDLRRQVHVLRFVLDSP